MKNEERTLNDTTHIIIAGCFCFVYFFVKEKMHLSNGAVEHTWQELLLCVCACLCLAVCVCLSLLLYLYLSSSLSLPPSLVCIIYVAVLDFFNPI